MRIARIALCALLFATACAAPSETASSNDASPQGGDVASESATDDTPSASDSASEAASPSQRGAADDLPTLVIGGIPDQDVSVLQERFDGIAEYLTEAVGINTEYRPSTNYAALVTAFSNGDVGLGWFGGLTGVQARLMTDGAEAVAQRPRDAEFHSVFIVGEGVTATTLEDLRGLSFTFGSESSTSGHLMPRFFLDEAGINPEADFDGPPSYSGSHDQTWKLVESGSFQAGALNEAVWESAVESGAVDTDKVSVVLTTPAYYDYHWVTNPELDEVYGAGTSAEIAQALIDFNAESTPTALRTLELFETDSFVATENANYDEIEQVARDLGLIGP